ncbi:MAG: VOC family protein [Rhizobiales bacterium]|nr:VOC family protein [Hyphomicrobiales bacterium]
MARAARSIDHCVLPAADLAAARERLSRLGFTVAPEGVHPFGTKNCCVYFADDTFIEPLAVADRVKTEIAAMRGNVFVARDRAWRYRRGEEGFSALVFATADADADHEGFVRAGLSAGDMLTFSRPFLDALGRKDKASFKLAFAADLRAPDTFFFTCERLNTPVVDRSALQRHPNGAKCIRAVRLSASEPADFAAFLQEVTWSKGVPAGDGMLSFEAGNGTLMVGRERPEPSGPNPGLRLSGIVFGVDDVASVAALLDAAGIDCQRDGGGLRVAASAGQGADFFFEET